MARRRFRPQRVRDKPAPDPIGLGRQLRLRKATLWAAVLAGVLALSLLDHAGGVLPVNDDWHRYHGQRFEVARVIDGDTLEVRAPDGDRATTRVRLWGVDTPELARPGDGVLAEPWAEQAADFTKRRTEGVRVTLYLQQHRLRGKYGRLLAYVELPDGADLNAELIGRGLARQENRWNHDRVAEYEALSLQAKRDGLGVWSD